MSIQIDERFEKIFPAAEKYCEGHTTEQILACLSKQKPGAIDTLSDDSFITKYQLTMLSLGIARRPDYNELLTPENTNTVTQIKNEALECVSNALAYEDALNKFTTALLGCDTPSSVDPERFFLNGNHLTRMLLSHIIPDTYGPQAAPKEFTKAVDLMADFWVYTLSGNSENILLQRWKTETNSDNFGLELMQASVSKFAEKDKYTEQQLNTFKETLKDHLLLTGIGHVSMKYDPDQSLRIACHEADIYCGKITFPMDTSTTYDTFSSSKPVLKIQNGRHSAPFTIELTEEAPDLPQARKKLTPPPHAL